MLLRSKPSLALIQAFLARQSSLPFRYPGIGLTRVQEAPPGYDQDYNFIELGRGEATFEAAKEAMRRWKMFPGNWAYIVPDTTPIREGEVVAMVARILGTWWLNSCRIVYTLDEERRFGFAYGTLPGHAERGEELFLVDMDAQGIVRYSLRAFSQPRHQLARLLYPVTRAYQRKFAQDSKASMYRVVREIGRN